jgi:putative hydrolase of the HAD superfamily
MIKAIVFDLDNTLLDFSGFKRESALAAAKAIREAGVKEGERELYRKIFAIYETRGIEYQRTFEELLSSYVLGPHLHEHAKQAAIIAYEKKKYALLRPRPKVVGTLKKLKQSYKLGIVTDAPREKAWQRLILSGLDHLFDVVVTYEDTRELKPSKQPFLRVIHLLGVSPREALFVGDNPERDIIGAKKAGLLTCLAKYGCQNYSEEENVADFTIERFEEIEKVLKDVGLE